MLKARYAIAAAAILSSTAVVATTGSQAPPPAPAPAPQAPAGSQHGARTGPGTFPAQQRPPGDPAVIARGEGAVRSRPARCATARTCAAASRRRQPAPIAGRAQRQGGRADPADRPRRPRRQGHAADPDGRSGRQGGRRIHPQHCRALAAPGHAAAAARSPAVLNVLVGDAAAGQAYFAAKCSSCHSPSGDMQGIATRIPDAKALQNLWVSGGAAGGRGGRGGGRGAGGNPNPARSPSPSRRRRVRKSRDGCCASTTSSSRWWRQTARSAASAATARSRRSKFTIRWSRTSKLLAEYTDKDMHNVTAYLATLK